MALNKNPTAETGREVLSQKDDKLMKALKNLEFILNTAEEIETANRGFRFPRKDEEPRHNN